MANVTQSISNTSGFSPQVWAMRALSVLRNNIVMTKLVTRDSDFEPGWVGQQLNIPYPGTFTTAKKAANTAASVVTPSGGTSVGVVLDQFAYVDFLVEDAARAQANSELMDRYIQPAAISLAETVENDIWNLVNQNNFTNTTVGTIGTDIADTTVRSAKKSLTDAKIAMNPRYLTVSTKDEISLIGNSVLQNYFAFAKPETVAKGAIGTVYGFDVYPSQLVPNAQVYKLVGASAVTTFTMTFNSVATSAITATSLTAATLQAALVANTAIGAGNANVWGTTWSSGSGTFYIQLNASLAAGNLTCSAPNTSGTTTLTQSTASGVPTMNFAFNPEAIILATRPFKEVPQGSGAQVVNVHDPVSGLHLRLMYWYDLNNRAVRIGMDMLYGVKVLRAAAGTIVYG